MIFLDIGLPQMDGYQLAARIRQRWPDKPPLLIAVTGYATADHYSRSREAGIALHLVKPVDLMELQSMLRQCETAAADEPLEGSPPDHPAAPAGPSLQLPT